MQKKTVACFLDTVYNELVLRKSSLWLLYLLYNFATVLIVDYNESEHNYLGWLLTEFDRQFIGSVAPPRLTLNGRPKSRPTLDAAKSPDPIADDLVDVSSQGACATPGEISDSLPCGQRFATPEPTDPRDDSFEVISETDSDEIRNRRTAPVSG